MALISRLDTQQSMTATHKLENKEQELSVRLKQNKVLQPLTHWRANNRVHQYAWNTVKHDSYTQARE